MIIAPILLFTYKRLDTLKSTVKALQCNTLASQSDLYVFSDAAKYEKDVLIVQSVREYIKTITGFKSVSIVNAETNKGLATSIISGVAMALETNEQVIVLEDDLSTTPNFLSYMNCCLNKYRAEQNVFSISGYSFNLGKPANEADDAYFLNRGWSWGWATWKDRWQKVDWQVKDYESFLGDRGARRAFALGGSDLNKMLAEQMSGKLDSWAIRWFYHQFRIHGLTIYPVYSKVFNNGFDQFATHTNGSSKRYLPSLDTTLDESFKLPEAIKINAYYQRQFRRRMGILARIKSKIETVLERIFK